MNLAHGDFDITITPQAQDAGAGSTLGRMTLEKMFRGDIEGTSKGEMLTAMMENDSAVYAAIERVTGTLHGRRGSFVLVHQGIAKCGEQSLKIVVAPDSGTDELRGIAGEMKILIEEGKHSYILDYSLADE